MALYSVVKPQPFLWTLKEGINVRLQGLSRLFVIHGLHGPGILLEKLLGPRKLFENDFLLENPLNFMQTSLNTIGYRKIS